MVNNSQLIVAHIDSIYSNRSFFFCRNFLVTNKRYHTNMSSVVLAQSGLYSSTIVLALNRGAHMDALCALAGAIVQDYAWYSNINEILHYLSDAMFTESIIYLQHIAIDYFDAIQKKIDKIDRYVLERLMTQLSPFSAIFRPVVSQLSSNFIESDTNDISKVCGICLTCVVAMYRHSLFVVCSFITETG